jgi:UDP-N-acetylmuramate--alanine ligase
LGLNETALAAAIRAQDVVLAESLDAASDLILERVRPGDVVLTLGAGDGDRVGERLLEVLGRDSRPAREE